MPTYKRAPLRPITAYINASKPKLIECYIIKILS